MVPSGALLRLERSGHAAGMPRAGMRRATHLQLTQRAEQLHQPACRGVERVGRGAAVRVEAEGEEEAR
jgi:hypothetical protein